MTPAEGEILTAVQALKAAIEKQATTLQALVEQNASLTDEVADLREKIHDLTDDTNDGYSRFNVDGYDDED